MNDYNDSETLYAARRHEVLFSGNIPESDRPVYHLPARIGWMNDPNGFSFYQGKYHLFYQYYPFDTKWGPMHWGHAVSADLLHWTHLPAALAPDQPYDDYGVFSGSAIVLSDGRHLLMYTGVKKIGKNPDGSVDSRQTQCIAFGDGVNYFKYEGNPVIDADQLPEGLDPQNFRDPKIWAGDDGLFHCIMGACNIVDRDDLASGQILQYKSRDCINWEFECVLSENNYRVGSMWECPDTFELDGKQVLLVSPQDMLAVGDEFASGNGTLALIGHLDPETGALVEESMQAIDYGIDFYATQTILSPDGRRIMVAWMQNWDCISMGGMRSWFGQVTVPRELSVREIRVIQIFVGKAVLLNQGIQIINFFSSKEIVTFCGNPSFFFVGTVDCGKPLCFGHNTFGMYTSLLRHSVKNVLYSLFYVFGIIYRVHLRIYTPQPRVKPILLWAVLPKPFP